MVTAAQVRPPSVVISRVPTELVEEVAMATPWVVVRAPRAVGGKRGRNRVKLPPPLVEVKASSAGLPDVYAPTPQMATRSWVLAAASAAGPPAVLHAGVHELQAPLCRRAPPTTVRSFSSPQPAEPWMTS